MHPDMIRDLAAQHRNGLLQAASRHNASRQHGTRHQAGRPPQRIASAAFSWLRRAGRRPAQPRPAGGPAVARQLPAAR